MLKLINDLTPFFEDNYRRVHVREYARLQRISPPTASKLLQEYYNEGLLKKEEDRGYLYFYADKESSTFIDLSRIYWKKILEKIGFIDYLRQQFTNPVIYIFGSFAKAEINPKSDIDVAVFSPAKKDINLEKFNQKLKKEIQFFTFTSRDDIGKELLNNILSGYLLEGKW